MGNGLSWRDRISEFKRVRATDIENAPWNFRQHPDEQVGKLAGSVEELGFYDPLKVYLTADKKYRLVDGEARLELIEARVGPDTLIPVVVTDFTESEAKKALLTHDQIGALATVDDQLLADLVADVAENSPIDDPELQKMVDDMLAEDGAAGDDEPGGDQSAQLSEKYEILVKCDNEQEQAELLERLENEGYECRSLIS